LVEVRSGVLVGWERENNVRAGVDEKRDARLVRCLTDSADAFALPVDRIKAFTVDDTVFRERTI
jgi:hypothetical protein